MSLSFALAMTARFRMMAVSATSGLFPALIIRWHVWRSMGLERLALKAAMKSADRLVPFRFRTDRFQVQANARDMQILNNISPWRFCINQRVASRISLALMTRQYSPSRFASERAWTSSAFHSLPFQSLRPKE